MRILILSLLFVCFAEAGQIPIISGPTVQHVPLEVLSKFGLTGTYGLPFPTIPNSTEELQEIVKNVNDVGVGLKPYFLLTVPVSTTARIAIRSLDYRIRPVVEWASAHLLNFFYYSHDAIFTNLKIVEGSLEWFLSGGRGGLCTGDYIMEQIMQNKCFHGPLNEEQKTAFASYASVIRKLYVANAMIIELLNDNQLTLPHFHQIIAGWNSSEMLLAIQIIQNQWCDILKPSYLAQSYVPLISDLVGQFNGSLSEINEKVVDYLENLKFHLRAEDFQKNGGFLHK